MLLFTYGFGGAVRVPGVAHWIDFLLPGLFVLSIGSGGFPDRVGLQNFDSSRCTVVLVDEPAKDVTAADRRTARWLVARGTIGRDKLQRPVGPCPVVVLQNFVGAHSPRGRLPNRAYRIAAGQ